MWVLVRWLVLAVPGGARSSTTRGRARVDLTALVSDVALPTPRRALERALYDRLLADADLHARVLSRVRFVTQTDYWYTPNSVLLMLLPTSDIRSSGYWVDFHGAPTREYRQTLAEVLAQWRHRWNARLVASWGTMLQFQWVVARRRATRRGPQPASSRRSPRTSN